MIVSFCKTLQHIEAGNQINPPPMITPLFVIPPWYWKNCQSPFTATPRQSNHLSLILPMHLLYLSVLPYLLRSCSMFSELILMIDYALISIVYYWFTLSTKRSSNKITIITKNINNNNNNNICKSNLWNRLARILVCPYSTNQSFIRNSLVKKC